MITEVDMVADAYPEMLCGLDCCGFLAEGGKVYWLSTPDRDSVMIRSECNYNESAGSGGDYAITAMDLGLSAKDAVKMAIKRDVYSGGRVRVFKL